MNSGKVGLLATVICVAEISGCASYRTSSNINSDVVVVNPDAQIIISEGSLPDRKYKDLKPIEVSIKKLTVFHDDPTKQQADAALEEKAKVIGADAVVNVVYEKGLGFTTWGYIDAEGMGVKFTD